MLGPRGHICEDEHPPSFVQRSPLTPQQLCKMAPSMWHLARALELKVAEERASLYEQPGFDVRWTHLDSALERVATARILEGIEVTSAHERLGANDYIYAPQARYGDAYRN